MDILRTPDERFENLPGYAFAPHYAEVGGLRIHFVDEGPREAAPVLLLHGQPSWSYLYRTMIPPLVAAGHRVVAPDLVGFGRSDKPAAEEDYTYARHVGWMTALIEALDLRDITLFCQDWGGLIGLRLAAEHGERFARIVAANTGLPTGDQPPSEAFLAWQRTAAERPELRPSTVVRGGTRSQPPREVLAAYDAPFPDARYLAGSRRFPQLVPTTPDDPASEDNRRAWLALGQWEKPFLCAFSDGDPITAGADVFFRRGIPGARGQQHVTIRDAGHFLQEDKGEELAGVVADFIARTR